MFRFKSISESFKNKKKNIVAATKPIEPREINKFLELLVPEIILYFLATSDPFIVSIK